MNRILVVDSYDSFTFNLVHTLEDIAKENVDVIRTDIASSSDIRSHEFIVFSPGPGLPDESVNLLKLVDESVRSRKKTLGVCLGCQAMALVSGGRLKNLNEVHHGVSHEIRIIESEPLFRNLPTTIHGGRYHSWVIENQSLGKEWIVSCRDLDGEIMGINHQTMPLFGIQFHPESVLTPQGKEILSNFLQI
jgi:anthranilate synthase component 2